jgi:LmbE family N-acetylglucosaminyl deacetylase
MKILVLSPHPDDEVLGCGGTIAKYAARGDEVSVCYVTVGYAPDWSEEHLQSKQVEIKSSNDILGISKRYDLNYPAVKLDTIPQKDINASLSKVIADVSPDCTLIPHRGDLNMDHRIIHEAALVALRPLSHRCAYILSYETLSETEWGTGISPFEPRYYVNISATLEIKIKAMEAFKTELKESPHPRSSDVIRCLARKRGSEILVDAAEAFIPIRIIEE